MPVKGKVGAPSRPSASRMRSRSAPQRSAPSGEGGSRRKSLAEATAPHASGAPLPAGSCGAMSTSCSDQPLAGSTADLSPIAGDYHERNCRPMAAAPSEPCPRRPPKIELRPMTVAELMLRRADGPPHLPSMPCARFEARRRALQLHPAPRSRLCVTQAAIGHRIARGWSSGWARSCSAGCRADWRSPTVRAGACFPRSATASIASPSWSEGIASGGAAQLLSVAAMGTFATGWLHPSAPRLPQQRRASISACSPTTSRGRHCRGGLDRAIRFGARRLARHRSRAARSRRR